MALPSPFLPQLEHSVSPSPCVPAEPPSASSPFRRGPGAPLHLFLDPAAEGAMKNREVYEVIAEPFAQMQCHCNNSM